MRALIQSNCLHYSTEPVFKYSTCALCHEVNYLLYITEIASNYSTCALLHGVNCLDYRRELVTIVHVLQALTLRTNLHNSTESALQYRTCV